jgi:outer membrane protein assembly factor BamB
MEDADFGIPHDEGPYRFYSIAKGGSIWSTPLVHKDMIVFGCNDGYVYALNKDGSKRWSFLTNDIVNSSPVVHNENIIFGSFDGYMYALSLEGELKWKFYTGNKVSASPLAVEGVVYFGSNNGNFYALSVDDGRELWKYRHTEGIFYMSAAAANDSIFFGHYIGGIFCLSKDGRFLWRTQTGDHTVQTPAVLGKNNEILCDFRSRSLERFPKSDQCRLYLASGDGYFRCLDAEDGYVVWKFLCNFVGSSSPKFSNDTFHFGSYDGNLYAIDIHGRLRWKFLTNNRIAPAPLIENNTIYFGSSDHNIYAIDLNGRLKWRYLTDGEIISSPMMKDNVLYIGSWDGHMYAIDVATKEVMWKFRTSMSPSYIKKPSLVAVNEETQKHELFETKTIAPHEIEKHYSIQSGELTNSFYGSPVNYKQRKNSYEPDDKYRR